MTERLVGTNIGQMQGTVYEVNGKFVLRNCAASCSILPCALRSKAGACYATIEGVDLQRKPVYCGKTPPKK